MGFAFLFDPGSRGVYGDWARDLVFQSGQLQHSGEVVRLRIGDLLYYNLPADKIPHDEIAERLECSNARPGLLRLALSQSLWKHRIHAIYADRLANRVALQLHACLWREPDYMGCYGVVPKLGLHRWLFDFTLLLRYRVAGAECWTDSEEEVDELEQLGCFQRVLHVPVFDEGFVDVNEWHEHCRAEAAQARLPGQLAD